eukprot:9491461-Pyramimonas_sp.AAC.1
MSRERVESTTCESFPEIYRRSPGEAPAKLRRSSGEAPANSGEAPAKLRRSSGEAPAKLRQRIRGRGG